MRVGANVLSTESSQYVWLGVDGWVRDIFVLDDLSIITPADLPSVRQATVGVLGIFFSVTFT